MLFALHLLSMALVCLKLAGTIDISWFTAVIPVLIALAGQLIQLAIYFFMVRNMDSGKWPGSRRFW